MIIEGAEFEDEPSYLDPETGNPVFYAKDVPEQIRCHGTINGFMSDSEESLDTLAPIERMQLGPSIWNDWVKAYQFRWLITEEKAGRLVSRWRRLSEIDEQHRHILFSDSVELDEDGRYNIDEGHQAGIVFPCKVDFKYSIFTGYVDFDHSYFRGLCVFRGAQFCEEASFSNTVFVSGVRFNQAKFEGDAWFDDARFQGTAGFMATSFGESLSFFDAIFERAATFKRMRVGGEADFSYAEFQWGLSFSNTHFQKSLNCSRAVFSSDVDCRETTFVGVVNYRAANFLGKLSMQRSVFLDESLWDESKFSMSVDFFKSQFLSKAYFGNTKIDTYMNLDHVWFGKTNNTPEPKQYRNWDSEVQTLYDYSNIDSCSKTVPGFKGATFSVAPNLGYTEVAIPPLPSIEGMSKRLLRFVGIRAGSTETKITDSFAASKLRRLQTLAAEGHNHLAEKRFFRAELLCRRGHEALGREIAMINLFEKVSECGHSFWKPMFALVLLIALSAGFYYSQINWFLVEGNGRFELVSYSFANSLPLLGYISDSYEVSVNVLFGGIEKVPPLVRVVAFVQNLVSAVFIFFGLLAIRNYFKLG